MPTANIDLLLSGNPDGSGFKLTLESWTEFASNAWPGTIQQDGQFEATLRPIPPTRDILAMRVTGQTNGARLRGRMSQVNNSSLPGTFACVWELDLVKR